MEEQNHYRHSSPPAICVEPSVSQSMLSVIRRGINWVVITNKKLSVAMNREQILRRVKRQKLLTNRALAAVINNMERERETVWRVRVTRDSGGAGLNL